MKSFRILSILISPILLSGCFSLTPPKQKEEKEEPTKQEINHTYDEIKDLKIYWNDIFKQPFNSYYVYLYSETCSHCNSIKNEMIEFALDAIEKIYFISSSAEHVLRETIDPFQRIESLDDLAIRGYPTLLKLEEKVVIKNIAGVKDIKRELSL